MTPQSNIEQAAQSTFARAVTNYGMPALLGVIGLLGGMVLADIRTQIADLARQQQQTGADVQVLNAKLDNGVIWRITELERRVNAVERVQKVP